jgi:hypothetical protein
MNFQQFSETLKPLYSLLVIPSSERQKETKHLLEMTPIAYDTVPHI